MIKYTMKILLFIMIFTFQLFGENSGQILLLHSYNKGLKWTDGISSGVESVMKKHPGFELSTEYMDSKKIDSKEYFDSLVKLYKMKFSTRKYSVIITSDNYAFEFVLKNHKKLFHNVPIVFCGLEDFNQNSISAAEKQKITGVVEYKDIVKNIKLIKTLIPDINTLYIISDNSFSSLAIKGQILNSIKPFEKDFNIIYDNDIILDKLEKKINKLPKHSAILFTSLYKDKFGRYIPYNDIRKLFHASIYPVFAINKIHLGEGIVGGVMINPFEQGKLAAQKAFEIINGKKPSNIEISIPTAKYYFDYDMLKKYNINDSKVPLLSNIINKPKNFFDTHRSLINSVFTLMPLLVFLIIGLIINIMKRIRLEIKLTEKNKLDNVLLNNIKSAVFWKSKDDTILGCNDSFCNILGLSREKIIGSYMKDILPELCQAIKEKNDFIQELEMKLYSVKDGPIDALIRRKAYFDKNNQEAGVVTLIGDITDIKKMALQRKREEQFLIQRSKLSEIGEMMISIAHQWKAPLVEISTIAQELLYLRKKREISELDTTQFVDDIMLQVKYMSSTIDDFRDFIKPSSSQKKFEITKAMEEIIKVIKHNLKYNYIDVEIVSNGNFVVFGYPNEFKQCILNIINNAKDSILKKREDHDFSAKITIEIYKKDKVYINIKDNGTGIEDKNLTLIFEQFFTSKKNGDGFGLYMTKLIIEEKMGGSIQALKYDDGAHIQIILDSVNIGR
ncbi:MAG: ABC transporter substrate binding protein [Sulfurospirillaceae bacterium]|nr:ABC transporter substrate binding protein [Sulfurospirillaceae bacterium]